MSSMQLSTEHLSTIVYGLQRHQVISDMMLIAELTDIVRELATHNLKEVSDRYHDPITEQLHFYEYNRPTNAKAISPIEFYKLAQCYQYNSSESPQWEGSQAQKWTDELMIATIQALPEYQSAAWII